MIQLLDSIITSNSPPSKIIRTQVIYQPKVDEHQVKLSRQVLEQSLKEQKEYSVTVADKEYFVIPGAFSPKYFDSTQIFSTNFPFKEGSSFLEIGCGTGATCIEAALAGCSSVTAVDISPAALLTTQKNANLHGMSSIVKVLHSDMFSNVEGKFDTIYWNLPFIYVKPNYQFKNLEEKALYDSGYATTDMFLSQSHKYLTPNGRLMIGFGDFGDEFLLELLCRKHGWTISEIHRENAVEGGSVQFILYEARLI